MLTLPASYREVLGFFVAHDWSFQQQVADPLGTSPQYVRMVLRAFWGHPELIPKGELEKQIMAKVEELVASVPHHVCATMTPTDM